MDTKTRIRIEDLREAKRRGQMWAMLTSYDATSARIFDLARIPCLLVGDSAAQAVFGHRSTLPITMDEMIPLARAVAGSCERALVIGDMPFGSYQESPELALRNATRFMKEAQVHGVKLEGGRELADHIRLLSRSGIPVMGHVGFTPQSEHALSGYKIQGRNETAVQGLLADAKSLEEAGAFACVIEMVPPSAAATVSAHLRIPTIGIGAGPHCDAQILVWTDMAGFTAPKGKLCGYLADSQPQQQVSTDDRDKKEVGGSSSNKKAAEAGQQLELNRVPKFVKRYANMSEILFEAAKTYAREVRLGLYPSDEFCYQ